MARAFLVVLDSVGCGGAPDAADYGDAGANTLGHILASQTVRLPNLDALGLGAAIRLASGVPTPGLDATPTGAWGVATEVSRGKDTISGHWELTGVPVDWDWHYFPHAVPVFPPDLLAEIAARGGAGGTLGNVHASGTEIIERLGAEHVATGWPICYTSADSVLQIAAHEGSFGLDRLLQLCAAMAPRLHAMRVGRVIARPFTGAPGAFGRTANRRDYALPPPAPTLCDDVRAAGGRVHAIGKISDIFAGRGVDDVAKGMSDVDLFQHLLTSAAVSEANSLTFANFIEFDSLYGHRRDAVGYARALEAFDVLLPAFLDALSDGDLAILTADHGNDPTWHGTDHTRERVPVLCHGLGARALGHVGFADVGATLAAHLGIGHSGAGRSFLEDA